MDKISVCMAAYNGGKFIKEQLESILEQLEDDAELIIVDDKSSDNTLEVIREVNDARIKVVENEYNLGVNASFELALKHANGDYIFLADQDDIWTKDRVKIMIYILEQEKALLVSGNSIAVDAEGCENGFQLGSLTYANSQKKLKNIFDIFLGRAAYYGCAMAFKRELLERILPFPSYIESHDLWIALAANLLKKNVHCEKVVLKRRVHGNNASIVNRSFKRKVYSRWIFIKSIYELLKRKSR